MKKCLFILVLVLCILLMSAAVAEMAESVDSVVVEVGTATLTLPSDFAYNEELSAQSDSIIYSDSEGRIIVMKCMPNQEDAAEIYNGAMLAVAIRTFLENGYDTVRPAGECAAVTGLHEDGFAQAMIINRYENVFVAVRCESTDDAMTTLNWLLHSATVPETPLK